MLGQVHLEVSSNTNVSWRSACSAAVELFGDGETVGLFFQLTSWNDLTTFEYFSPAVPGVKTDRACNACRDDLSAHGKVPPRKRNTYEVHSGTAPPLSSKIRDQRCALEASYLRRTERLTAALNMYPAKRCRPWLREVMLWQGEGAVDPPPRRPPTALT